MLEMEILNLLYILNYGNVLDMCYSYKKWHFTDVIKLIGLTGAVELTARVNRQKLPASHLLFPAADS